MNQQQRLQPDDSLDELVENALLRRATGYEDTSGKTVPPDVRAAMYWLENRRPDRWKRSPGRAVRDEEPEFSEEEKAL